VGPDGAATPESTLYTKQVKKDQKKWKINSDKIRQSLVESLCENKQTKLMALEFQKLPTVEFYASLKSRVKDTSSQSLNFHTGILNAMKCLSNETRCEFSDRLVTQFLVVMNLGGVVDEAWRVERLLNGLKAHPKYQLEANLLELLPNQTWDTITNQLRQYDRSDANLKQESANAAIPIICHTCNTVGHKSPDCPQRGQRSGKGRSNGRGGGKGGNYRGKGGKGNSKNGGRGNNQGGKGSNYQTNHSRVCHLCNKAGHLAKDCFHAKEFAKMLAKRKGDSGEKQHKKQRNESNDEDYGEYSMMLQPVIDEQSDECTLSAYTAALDSGCSSHTIKSSCLPETTVVDNSNVVNIQTASSGTTLSAFGKASEGLVRNALVVDDKHLTKNLVSIAKLDRAGYTTTFCNGEGIVTDSKGKIVTRAPLSNHDLYEFDIREMFSSNMDTALLGSVTLDENNLETWHLRLGHRNIQDLKTAVKKNLISGVPASILKSKKRRHSLCDSCVRAKSTKYIRRKKARNTHLQQSNQSKSSQISHDGEDSYESVDESDGGNEIKLTDVPVGRSRDIAKAQPLTNSIPIMYTDLKGPFPTAGIKGELYAQSFIEGNTKYLRRYYFTYKSECITNLRDLLDSQLKAEDTRLLAYCSDGALELISRDCIKLLAQYGSKFIYSPPYSPNLNSIVERNHRTTFESAHAMLNESGLPNIFWVYAAEYSTYVYNCLPTETSSGYMSPIQARYGIIPDVSRLRRFGCTCYCHIPTETREKGFIDKAYKCYFIGIHMPTQAYKCWVIDNNEEKISPSVIFDEITPIKIQLSNPIVPIAQDSKNKKDYNYLIGMVYRDDENKLLYVTSRIVVQKGFLVAYRCAYIHNVVGQEEPNPIHVADVDRMLHTYVIDSQPMVVLAGDISATKIEVLQTPFVGKDKILNETNSVSSIKFSDIYKSDAKHESVDLSEDHLLNSRVKDIGVQRPRGGRQKSTATAAHDSQLEVKPSTGTISHRFPRSAHNVRRHTVSIGKNEDSALMVQVNHFNDVYDIYLPALIPDTDEYAYLSSRNSMSVEELDKWRDSDLTEVKSLVCEHEVWDVLKPPPDANIMTSKWVRLIKPSGLYKSRMVGRGFNMIHGIDYHETFAPVAKLVTFRIFLTLLAVYSLFTGALDVKTAFLNAPLDEDVWMEPPSNLYYLLSKLLLDTSITPDQRKRISKHMKRLKRGEKLKLLKALYGTKQAGRQWYLLLDEFLKSQGFVPNKADHCFYTLIINNVEYVLLLLYVDDIIIAATSAELCLKYAKIIGKRFRISYSGELISYLNISIAHDRDGKKISLSQTRYIEDLINQFDISIDTSIRSPMQENLKLLATEEESVTPKQLQYAGKFPYRQLIGAILYLNMCTRPDISYAVSILAQFNVKPTFLACKALVRLARFIYNTRNDKLILGGGADIPVITSFCDSDWGGCINTRYSRSGHIIFMGNGPVTWYSKRQTNVAQSSAEAEFMAKAPCIQNTNFCRRIVNSANIPNVIYRLASGLFSDNESSIAIASNPVFHQRTKHISIKYQYVNENVERGAVVLEYVRSKDNYSDMMTKPVGQNIFQLHYPYVMGGQQVPRVRRLMKTVMEDSLPCPYCASGLLGEDQQL
jgi:hypothetical protein